MAKDDPFLNFNFEVALGTEKMYFTQCSGLGADIEAIQYREGGNSHITRYVPGRVSYTEVTLKFGVSESASKTVWEWLQKSITGKVERKNISIKLLSPDEEKEGFQWDLSNAWPKSWRASPLDGLGKEIAIDTLTLVYEDLERK